MKRPAAPCACLLLALSFLAVYAGRVAFFLSTAAALIFCGVRLVCLRRRGGVSSALCLLAVVIYALHAGFQLLRLDAFVYPAAGASAYAVAQVTEEPAQAGDLTVYEVRTLRVARENFPQNLRMEWLCAEPNGAEAGDILCGKIQFASEKNDPYQPSLLADGFVSSAYLSDAAVFAPAHKSLICAVAALRGYIRKTVFHAVPAERGAVLLALLIGDRRFLSADSSAVIRAAGVSHVMVVSGLHLAILSEAVSKVARRLRASRRVESVLQLVLIFALMAICGFTMSIRRAGLTYLILHVGRLLHRKPDGGNSLAAAVVLILLHAPFAVGSVSFLLSVAATFGILVLAPRWIRYFSARLPVSFWPRRILSGVVSLACVTLSATLCTLPICIFYFGAVSLVAVFTNLLLAHAVSAALLLVSAALLFSPLRGVSTFLFAAADLVCRYLLAVIAFFGGLPFAQISVPRAALLFLLPAAGVALCFYLRRNRSRRKKGD